MDRKNPKNPTPKTPTPKTPEHRKELLQAKKSVAPICRDVRFANDTGNLWGRTLCEWYGVLKGMPDYRYWLRCQHTRVDLDEETPYVIAVPGATHHFHCLYQSRTNSAVIHTLFHWEYDLGTMLLEKAADTLPALRHNAIALAEKKLDTCATAITNAIAAIMVKVAECNGRYAESQRKGVIANLSTDEFFVKDMLVHPKDRAEQMMHSIDCFWSQVIEVALSHCDHIPDLDKLKATRAHREQVSRTHILNLQKKERGSSPSVTGQTTTPFQDLQKHCD